MAYTVLARKYRSRNFEEVIGQQPVATTLANAVRTGRIHHGYLFTGTRGVGKTSMARILAKALNCQKYDAPTPTPCCECDSCRSIAEGQDIDVVEIDAASNTGVDNIRELRSNAAYRPSRSRFKIYIIDEVHMLSTGAFNALLKTLEEPPEHVKFILATTEIQKVPATIQSRCQRFSFRHIGPEAIAERLGQIIEAEGAKAEPVVLRRIARLAHGSMRDALSIADQLLSVSPEKLTADVLDELLPPAQDEQVFALLQHVAEGDAAAVLAGVDRILAEGRGLEVFIQDLTETVRSLMLIRACGPDAPMVDVPAGAREEYAALSGRFELSQYVQMIAMLEELRRNVRYSGAGRALTDALLIRLARMSQWQPIEQLLSDLAAGGGEAPAAAAGGGEKKKSSGPDSGGAERAPLASSAASRFRPESVETGVPAAAARGALRESPPASNAEPRTRAATAITTTLQEAPAEAGTESTSLPEPDYGGGVEAAPSPEPDYEDIAADEAPMEAPDDYVPVEVEAPAVAPRRKRSRSAVSKDDRQRVMQDPVVRAVMELFDGELVYVERRPQPPAEPVRE